MKWKKLVAAMLAAFMIGGTFTDYASIVKDSVITAGAEEEYTEVTEGVLTYHVYADHAELYDCAFGVGEITIPDKFNGVPVTSIGSYACEYCSKLTSITIPDSVTSIGARAFDECSSLTSIIIPDSVTFIGESAFAGCTSLKSVTIPDSVTSIGENAFSQTPWFNAKQKENPLVIINGILIDGTKCSGKVTVSSDVKTIGNWAFYNAHELQHLDIPEGVEEIGDGAFYGCTYLEDMVLPSSIRAIGDNCFALCSKLAKIVCNATTPPAIQAKTFYDVNRQIPVYVPDESVASYESDEYWKEFDIQGALDIESAVSNMTNDSATAITKVMRDGQVLIMRGGKMYNLQGVEVK